MLWFAEYDLERAIKIWRFTTHVWGVALSPFIVTRCIHQIAKENCTKASSLTANSIVSNLYVDDFLCRLDTIEEVRTFRRDVVDTAERADRCY